MDSALIALGAGVFVFAIMRTLFAFLAWLFPEADAGHRRQLDHMFDALDRHSLFDLGQITLVRLMKPINRFFSRSPRSYVIVGAFSFLQNAIVFTVVSTLVIASHFWMLSWGIQATVESVEKAGLLNFSAMNILVAILGTAFDLFSLRVTILLINWATSARTGSLLSAHLAFDLIVAAVSCMWAYVMLDITLRTFYPQIVPYVSDYAGGSPGAYMAPTLWETLQVNPEVWYIVVGLGVSAALPTIIYLLALFPVVSLRAIPKRVQAVLGRIVFLLTTDDAPVLKQLAAFTSNAGALVAATVAWIEFTPH